MEEQGLSGILIIGKPIQPLLDILVTEGRAGMVVVGGLNPISAVHEAGIDVTIHSLAELGDVANWFATQGCERLDSKIPVSVIGVKQ